MSDSCVYDISHPSLHQWPGMPPQATVEEGSEALRFWKNLR